MGMLLRRYHDKSTEQAKEDSVNEVIQEDQANQENQVGLEDKKVDELKELAKEAGVENYSKLKKSELIDELNSL